MFWIVVLFVIQPVVALAVLVYFEALGWDTGSSSSVVPVVWLVTLAVGELFRWATGERWLPPVWSELRAARARARQKRAQRPGIGKLVNIGRASPPLTMGEARRLLGGKPRPGDDEPIWGAKRDIDVDPS